MRSVSNQDVHKLLAISILAITILNGCGRKSEDYLLLNGSWRVCFDPAQVFTRSDSTVDKWHDIQVPGECQMQGFAIRHEIPFLYKKSFMVPSDFTNKDVILYFDGVYGYARVWVNGNYVRDHTGGFTRWDCNITPFVSPGDETTITVECTDKRNDQSYASGYAKHQIGGILRDVYVRALPKERIKDYYIETRFDDNFSNAVLLIDLDISLKEDADLTVHLSDRKGNEIDLQGNRVKLLAADNHKLLEYMISTPHKWDAEHPYLYSLTVELERNKKPIQILQEKVGFRSVKIKGNQMFINGMPVKLRGACRHDVNPLLGRSSSSEYDLLDAILAKEANINFIRTSHYPPSKRFADLCDSIGIYLEVENAACFVRTHRLPEYDTVTHAGSGFDESLNLQLKEMVQTFRNSPSVIIWSLGNESVYDETFRHGYDYLKATDPGRPVIFSYPGTVPEGVRCFDILSMHYPIYNGKSDNSGIKISDFISDTIPVLYDEWAHVACYNKPALQSDSYVREFWGIGLDSMWINCYGAEGALGGAIWGMIDETFMMPDTMTGFDKWWGINPKDSKVKYECSTIGYGEWGVLDVWRRKKPEFWSVMKSYSPVRLKTSEISIASPGEPLKLEVLNRFNHSDLNEISAEWSYDGASGSLTFPSIEPGNSGFLQVPGQSWKAGTELELSFRDQDNRLIDRYKVIIERKSSFMPAIKHEEPTPPVIREGDSLIKVIFENWYIDFSKQTGLISAAVFKGDTLITGGPFLQYTVAGEYLAFTTREHISLANSWKLQEFTARNEGNNAVINIMGIYGTSLQVDIRLTVRPDGNIITGYSFEKPVAGELIELGIKYHLTGSFDKLRWKRKSYWSDYPEDHLGRPEGEAAIRNFIKEPYRSVPVKAWEDDVCNFYYKGIKNPQYIYGLPNIVTALKENIYNYSLINSASGNSLSILSEGLLSCRIFQDSHDRITLVADNLWDYPDLMWGNYMKLVNIPVKVNFEVLMEFR